MNLKNVLQGVDILQWYITEDESKSYPFCAEHDALYFQTDKSVSKKDVEILDSLGWYCENAGAPSLYNYTMFCANI